MAESQKLIFSLVLLPHAKLTVNIFAKHTRLSFHIKLLYKLLNINGRQVLRIIFQSKLAVCCQLHYFPSNATAHHIVSYAN